MSASILARRGLTLLAALIVLGLAIATVVITTENATRRVTTYFPQAVGLHAGDEVRMLGVPVGRVEDVVPEGDQVRVELSYDAEHQLPQDATAAVVTPTLVSVRYVQLGPVHDGGPVLADGATIPASNTAIPIEWDQLKTELDGLAATLGPTGANKDGALSRLVQVSADNLDGQGAEINQSIDGLSRAFATLSDGRTDLFATVRNLQVFTAALEQSDAQVEQFNRRLDEVTEVLDSSSGDLTALLTTLDRSAPVVESFVADHRDELAATTGSIADVTGNLSQSRQALADVLQRAPIALSNLHNIYDPFSGGITTSLANSNFNDPAQFTCGAGFGVIPGGPDNPEAISFCQEALGPLLDAFRMPAVPVGTTPVEREPSPDGPSGNLADLLLPEGTR
jgi:virulence factor Mce family protein